MTVSNGMRTATSGCKQPANKQALLYDKNFYGRSDTELKLYQKGARVTIELRSRLIDAHVDGLSISRNFFGGKTLPTGTIHSCRAVVYSGLSCAQIWAYSHFMEQYSAPTSMLPRLPLLNESRQEISWQNHEQLQGKKVPSDITYVVA